VPAVTTKGEGADRPNETERFTALYRDHHALVRAFASRRVGVDLAQEIVSDTFLVAWRRIHDIPETPVPWLYRVALFEIANLQRRHARAARLHHALVQSRSGLGPEDAPDGYSELARAVGRAFASLPQRDQEILRLAAWEQLSNAEGAAVLGCSVSAYRMRLHRARIRLANTSDARELLRSERATPESAMVPPTSVVVGRQPFNGPGWLL
jgi:RNA polymerase sigma-70 factor (ECF subfamily)